MPRLPRAPRSAAHRSDETIRAARRPWAASALNQHHRPRDRALRKPGNRHGDALGETRLRENLAFVPMEIPLPGESSRSITFGLVREGGNWKLLSVD